MSIPARFRHLGLLIASVGLGALAAQLLTTALPRARQPMTIWAPVISDADVEDELREGCQQLINLIENGSPAAGWAVGRLRMAVDDPVMGPSIQALAHHGLALAYRLGRGVAIDPTTAAAHQARSEDLSSRPRLSFI